MRREFLIPEEDIEFLNSRDWTWELVEEGGNRLVLIHGFPVPKGYTVNQTTVAIQILSGYPTTPLDMAYFHPKLEREDNILIGQADQTMSIEGSSFQRWSRHYRWEVGFHTLTTHILAIEDWLKREFVIKPFRGVS
ncbi:hypothetical protein IM538_18565 [Cytobacillus suaedae]|nr:hypothetical protein IM538_18565 [Cytobacillus suaedae]